MRHVVVMTATGAVGLVAIFFVDLLSLLYISWLGDPRLTAGVGPRHHRPVLHHLDQCRADDRRRRPRVAGARRRRARRARAGSPASTCLHMGVAALVGPLVLLALAAVCSSTARRERRDAARVAERLPLDHPAVERPHGARHGLVGRAARRRRRQARHVRDAVRRGRDGRRSTRFSSSASVSAPTAPPSPPSCRASLFAVVGLHGAVRDPRPRRLPAPRRCLRRCPADVRHRRCRPSSPTSRRRSASAFFAGILARFGDEAIAAHRHHRPARAGRLRRPVRLVGRDRADPRPELGRPALRPHARGLARRHRVHWASTSLSSGCCCSPCAGRSPGSSGPRASLPTSSRSSA